MRSGRADPSAPMCLACSPPGQSRPAQDGDPAVEAGPALILPSSSGAAQRRPEDPAAHALKPPMVAALRAELLGARVKPEHDEFYEVAAALRPKENPAPGGARGSLDRSGRRLTSDGSVWFFCCIPDKTCL